MGALEVASAAELQSKEYSELGISGDISGKSHRSHSNRWLHGRLAASAFLSRSLFVQSSREALSLPRPAQYLDTATLFLFGESIDSLSGDTSVEAEMFLKAFDHSILIGTAKPTMIEASIAKLSPNTNRERISSVSSLPSRAYETIVSVSLSFSHVTSRTQVAAGKLRRSWSCYRSFHSLHREAI